MARLIVSTPSLTKHRKREMNAPPGAMAGLTGSQDHTLIPTLDMIIP